MRQLPLQASEEREFTDLDLWHSAIPGMWTPDEGHRRLMTETANPKIGRYEVIRSVGRGSQEAVFPGVEKVRMTANSLSFFGHMKSDSSVLKDSMTKSFLSGLISRHLAQRAKLTASEEAFICGMCQNLVVFYFSEESDDIRKMQSSKGLDKSAAARGVLGVSDSDLGAVVAKAWNLPRSIIDSIPGIPPGPVSTPETELEKLRDIAVFSNELCDVFQN